MTNSGNETVNKAEHVKARINDATIGVGGIGA
jgi:hypothetical protein